MYFLHCCWDIWGFVRQIGCKKKKIRKSMRFLLIGLLALSMIGHADFRAAGFACILVMWLFRCHPVFRAVVGACMLPKAWVSVFAFLPIGMYNGKRGFIRGRLLQILFYAIYPAHMLVFYLIKNATVGY